MSVFYVLIPPISCAVPQNSHLVVYSAWKQKQQLLQAAGEIPPVLGAGDTSTARPLQHFPSLSPFPDPEQRCSCKNHRIVQVWKDLQGLWVPCQQPGEETPGDTHIPSSNSPPLSPGHGGWKGGAASAQGWLSSELWKSSELGWQGLTAIKG